MLVVRIGIVGLGYTGQRHLSLYLDDKRCRVEFIAKRKIVSVPGIPVYDDYKKALLKHKVDAVSICTPTETHFPIAKFFLMNGVHVFVEKPLGMTSEEARALHKIAFQKGLIIMVNHTEIYDRHVNRLIRLSRERKVERIISMRGGGDFSKERKISASEETLHDRLIHSCATVDAIAMSVPARIVTQEKTISDIEKLSSSVIFENGIRADIRVLTVPRASLYKRIEVTGKDFSLRYLLSNGKGSLILTEHGKTSIVEPILAGDDFTNAVNAFVDTLIEGEKLSLSGNAERTICLAGRVMKKFDEDLKTFSLFKEESQLAEFKEAFERYSGLWPELMRLLSPRDPKHHFNSGEFSMFKKLGYLIWKEGKSPLAAADIEKQYTGRSILVRMNTECNENCLFCNVRGIEEPDDYMQELKDGIKTAYQVILSGGEPTIKSELRKVIRMASNLGYTEINLQTNALVFSNIDCLIPLVMEGLNYSLVSLHSNKAVVSDRLTRVPGGFSKTFDGIKNMILCGVDVRIAHVLNTENFRDFPEFVDFVHENLSRVKCIDLLFNCFRGQGKEHPELLPRLSEIRPFVEMGYAHGIMRGITVTNAFALPLCHYRFGLSDSNEHNALKGGADLSSLSQEKKKGPQCKACIYSNLCLGMWSSYIDHYGDQELTAVRGHFSSEYGFPGAKLSRGKSLSLQLKRLSEGKGEEIRFKARDYRGITKKILLFRNPMHYKGKEENSWFYQGSLFIASALKKEGIPIAISESKPGAPDLDLSGVNIVLISLSEFFFPDVERLCERIREKSKAFIIVGGIMPTLTPEHVLVHLPLADMIIRGAGEGIVPEIAKILSGRDFGDGLTADEMGAFAKLKGVFFRGRDFLASFDSDKINFLDNLDESTLDFSLLDRENLQDGLNLSTSRGCSHSCMFCTTVGRGRYRSASFPWLVRTIVSYEKRLNELYGKDIPQPAYKLSFNDDDFLGDKGRAIAFFDFLRKTKFKISFFQTGIRSFLSGKEVDKELIESLSPELFSSDSEYNIYIGTENFNDQELASMGKGYTFLEIKRVVSALSKKGIKQGHHLIFSNPETTISRIFDNMIKITRLYARSSPYFKLLSPIIKAQISLFPSASYRKHKDSGQLLMTWLKRKGFPMHDYPLVTEDRPMDGIARLSAEVSETLFLGRYQEAWGKLLIFLLEKAERESDPDMSEKLYYITDSYRDYPSIVFPEKKLRRAVFRQEKNNLELMITRKCQLRCRYCPVVKDEREMDEEIIRKSIGLLVKSGQKGARVDFLGGEPLLAFDRIKEAVMQSKGMTYFMITNTLSLKPHMVDFMKEHDFLLELSLDGDEETHNMNKIPLFPGLNPYRKMRENISRILKAGIRNYAIMVVTPKTCGKVYENFRHLSSLGLSNIHINYSFGTSWDEDSLKTFFSGLDHIKKEFLSDIRAGKIKLGNLSTRKEPAIINSELMVDTDGSIHLMSEWIFESTRRCTSSLGHISDIESFSDLFFDDFMSYLAISRNYTRKDPELKRIVLNNIDTGRRFDAYFSTWNK